MTRGVLVVGSGRRVREAALPALARVDRVFSLRAVVARTAKRIESAGRAYDVRAVAGLGADDLRGVELVYLAVGKPNVPAALAALARFDVSRVDLLIDTPVLLPRHFRHLPLLKKFRSATVSEDVAVLPWIDLVRESIDAGELGELSRVVFDRSAYAYHGIAAAKAILGSDRVVRASRRKRAGGGATREVRFAGGLRAVMEEPRDYSVGSVSIEGARRTVTDDPSRAASSLVLRPRLEAGALTGFGLGDRESLLDAEEASLALGDPPGATVTARMESMKRVGFLRLLRRIASGQGAYPLDDALDDALVDYALEKVGWYVASPLTSARSPLTRAWLGAIGSIARR